MHVSGSVSPPLFLQQLVCLCPQAPQNFLVCFLLLLVFLHFLLQLLLEQCQLSIGHLDNKKQPITESLVIEGQLITSTFIVIRTVWTYLNIGGDLLYVFLDGGELVFALDVDFVAAAHLFFDLFLQILDTPLLFVDVALDK